MRATTRPATVPSSTGAPGMTTPLRRALPVVLLAAAVVIIGLAGRNGRAGGDPLDPRSTEPLGTRALVLLLEHFGADVKITGEMPPAGGTALLLQDRLGEGGTARLHNWVAGGGTLIVADPSSSFAPRLERDRGDLFAVGDTQHATLSVGEGCGLPAIAGVRRVSAPGAAGFRVRAGSIGCFRAGGGSYLVARQVGTGTVVALGGAAPFTNDRLDDVDDAALALALVAPQRGATVHLLEPSAPGSGRQKLRDLVSRRVKDGLWQLLIAFVVFALWRARRLGRPQLEPQPVDIAGSELVIAVANLLQQGRRRGAAAAMLRSQLRRTLVERFGVARDAPAETLAVATAARAGVDADVVRRALAAGDPADDAELVELARSIEALRDEVTRV